MPQLTILEGSTFCISDELGDVRETTHGLFAEDTRFLSRLCLTIDGKRPLLLSSGTVEYFSAAFFLRNPLTERLPLDAVSVRRERFVGDGMQDHVVGQRAVAIERERQRAVAQCRTDRERQIAKKIDPIPGDHSRAHGPAAIEVDVADVQRDRIDIVEAESMLRHQTEHGGERPVQMPA